MKKTDSMDLNKDRLKIVYDREADVLYVTNGAPEHTDYVEYTEDVILRFHPETKQLVGFTLIDFSEHFAQKDSGIALPFGVDFHAYAVPRT
jgi:uncharacterized protein YuzE